MAGSSAVDASSIPTQAAPLLTFADVSKRFRDGTVALDGADFQVGAGEFVSVVERPPVYGLQSHPEKSGPDGLRLLANFVRAAAR